MCCCKKTRRTCFKHRERIDQALEIIAKYGYQSGVELKKG